jgi:hypothetical protein
LVLLFGGLAVDVAAAAAAVDEGKKPALEGEGEGVLRQSWT